MTRIIGFNLSHDSSACLVEDGVVRAALALERTTKLKRGVVPAHAYAAAMADLTHQLLACCGVRYGDVDFWIATSTESRDQEEEALLLSALGLIAPPDRVLAMPHPSHHLAHASAAFYSSGFAEATAVVIDAYGSRINDDQRERETAFGFRAGRPPQTLWRQLRDGQRVAGHRQHGVVWIPQQLSGIGELYRVVTLALGFNEGGTTYDDAGKTMGLAPYGERVSQQDLFIHAGPEGLSFDRAVASLAELGLLIPRADGFELRQRRRGEPLQKFHRDLAAQIQSEFEEACLYLVRMALAASGRRSLVLSGGCFLNSVLNRRVIEETEAQEVFIFPAATDDGNAVGAALYAHHVLIDRPAGPALPPRALEHVYLGPPRVSGVDVTALAAAWRLSAVDHDSQAKAAAAAAQAVAEGEIVGWFQDRAELGPRALGSRSILCHPGIPGMKDRLNSRVKFREPFRPFAASVLVEDAGEWFELPTSDSRFMLIVSQVRPERRTAISEVVHVDGSCRIQTVDDTLPGAFRELLRSFKAQTGIPLVLNTSFNLRGMPIVEEAADAFDCLYGSRLDRIFIGSLEFEAPDHAALVPQDTRPPGAVVGSGEAALLERCQGQETLREIAASLEMKEDDAVDMALGLRRHGLLRWAGLGERPRLRLPLPQYSPAD